MNLAKLIRGKNEPVAVATAIPAIFATQPKREAVTVARIATIAVASPTSEKTAPPATVTTAAPATVSRLWLLHYPDRDPVQVSVVSGATRAEILAWNPDAVAAEPFTPTIRQPTAPLTASDETAIRAWLALIEETDPATIAEVIGQCQWDADARDYFTGRAAAERPNPAFQTATPPVRCADCAQAEPVDGHPTLIHCGVGRESPAPTGAFWGGDPRQCSAFAASAD